MANIDPWLASALLFSQLGQGLSAPRRMGQSSLSQFTGALGGAANSLLQLMMLERKENDPMRQLEMEKMKAEIEAFNNPRPKPMTEYEIKQTEFKTEEQKREAEKTRQALEEKKLGKRKEEIKEYNTAAYFDMENQFPGQPEVVKTGQAATRQAAIGAGADPSKRPSILRSKAVFL